jgi:hypothetical protein
MELEDEPHLPVAQRRESGSGSEKTSMPSRSRLPPDGESRHPRRCRSVLLPTPTSMIATRSLRGDVEIETAQHPTTAGPST